MILREPAALFGVNASFCTLSHVSSIYLLRNVELVVGVCDGLY